MDGGGRAAGGENGKQEKQGKQADGFLHCGILNHSRQERFMQSIVSGNPKIEYNT
jgi:hypothetical protein